MNMLIDACKTDIINNTYKCIYFNLNAFGCIFSLVEKIPLVLQLSDFMICHVLGNQVVAQCIWMLYFLLVTRLTGIVFG